MTQEQDPQQRRRITAPEKEDVKVIDLNVKHTMLILLGILATAGLGYGIYTMIRTHAEMRKMQMIAHSIDGIVSNLAKITGRIPVNNETNGQVKMRPKSKATG